MRPRRKHDYDATPTPDDQDELAPHGDVTEGVTLRVTLSDPEFIHPRKPPDPSEYRSRNDDIRRCRNKYDELTATEDQGNLAPQGEDTEGKTPQVPHSDPDIRHPREPTDSVVGRSRKKAVWTPTEVNTNGTPLRFPREEDEQMRKSDVIGNKPPDGTNPDPAVAAQPEPPDTTKTKIICGRYISHHGLLQHEQPTQYDRENDIYEKWHVQIVQDGEMDVPPDRRRATVRNGQWSALVKTYSLRKKKKWRSRNFETRRDARKTSHSTRRRPRRHTPCSVHPEFTRTNINNAFMLRTGRSQCRGYFQHARPPDWAIFHCNSMGMKRTSYGQPSTRGTHNRKRFGQLQERKLFRRRSQGGNMSKNDGIPPHQIEETPRPDKGTRPGISFADATKSPAVLHQTILTPENVFLLTIKCDAKPNQGYWEALIESIAPVMKALDMKGKRIAELRNKGNTISCDELQKLRLKKALKFLNISGQNLKKLSSRAGNKGGFISYTIALSTPKDLDLRTVQEASAALYNDEAIIKKGQGRISFEVQPHNLLDAVSVGIIVKTPQSSRGDDHDREDVRKAIIGLLTQTYREQGDSLAAAKEKAEGEWLSLPLQVMTMYPKGHYDDLERFCRDQHYSSQVKKVKMILMEADDASKFEEIGDFSKLEGMLRQFLGRRAQLLTGVDDGDDFEEADTLTALLNNCHYRHACAVAPVRASAFHIDAPVELKPLDGSKEELTTLRNALLMFTLDPTVGGTTRYLVQGVLTTAKSKIQVAFIKSEDHKTEVKLLAENAPGYLFFELAKKYDILSVYEALMKWFGRAAVKASLARTSYSGTSIVTDGANDRGSTRVSETRFLLEQGLDNMLGQDAAAGLAFDPETETLGSALPQDDEWYNGNEFPFELDTPASDLVEAAMKTANQQEDKERPIGKRDREPSDEDSGMKTGDDDEDGNSQSDTGEMMIDNHV